MTEDQDASSRGGPPADWDPHAPNVVRDQRAAYDRMRDRCPVAHGVDGGWTVFRHADVVQALHDHATFSNVVSQHPAVPNGMDPPQHTAYRRLVDRYFSADRIADFEPVCRKIAADLVDIACTKGRVELSADLARPFAARAQCAYLGWPAATSDALIDWVRRNHEATLANDRPAMATIAAEFEAIVDDLIRSRQRDDGDGPADVIGALLRDTIDGRRLSPAEITSIVRNWTMGEIGTIAAAVGIVTHFLAHDEDVQHQVRRHLVLMPFAIDEILRIHGPLVSNRRTLSRPLTIGGRQLDAGARVTLNWIAANRDPAVFEQPDVFRLSRDPAANLLYGAGVHVCPGASLARLELRIVMEELLAATRAIEPVPGCPATNAVPPASGFDTLPLLLVRASG